MVKNSISNQITPCCGLPFSVIYWWITNLNLNTEGDRQYLITQLQQNGNLTVAGWRVLASSGVLEADASFTREELVSWFEFDRKPNCNELKLIIEGLQIGSWVPETQIPSNIATVDEDLNGLPMPGNVYTKEQTGALLLGSFGGDLAVADNPAPTAAKWYFAKESGTYANAGNLAVNLSNKMVILNYDGTAWSKVEIDVPETDLTPLFEINANAFKVDGLALISSGDEIFDANGYVSARRIPTFGIKSVRVDGISPSEGNGKAFVELSAGGGIISATEITTIPFYKTLNANTQFVSFTIRQANEVNNDSVNNVKFYFENFTETFTKELFKKKGISFGDSITWYDEKQFSETQSEYGQIVRGYQSWMQVFLGAEITNEGRSGWNLIDIQTVIKGYANFDNFDFITITSGANDHRTGVTLGTIQAVGGAHNTGTFYGALQSSIEYALTKKPTLKIYLITPINGWFNENGTPDVPSLYNGETNISDDFADAFKAVGKLYGLPVIDLYGESQINFYNKAVYLGDIQPQAYYLHPKNSGFELMGKTILKEFK